MKKILRNISYFVMGVVGFALTACSDSYPGLEYISNDPDNPLNNTESSDQDPIMVFVRDPFFISINNTRSQGAYDPEQIWWTAHRKDKTRFYLYAFREAREDNPPLNYEPNYRAHFSTDYPSHDDCLIDNTVNTPGSELGLEVKINDVGGVDGLEHTVNTENGPTLLPLYWSSTHQQTGYAFSMYRIDEDFDYSAHIHRDADKIWFDVDIDGAQDIMCGVAPRLRTVGEVRDKLNYFETSQGGDYEQDLRNMADYGYSTYSAHRGLHPTIPVTHQLTRLNFDAYPGDSSANKIEILKVEIEVPTQGKFVVASRNPEEIGITFDENSVHSVVLQQLNSDSTAMEPMKPVKVQWDQSKWTPGSNGTANRWLDQEPVRMGESMLLPSREKYKLTIHYIDQIEAGSNNTIDLQLHSEYWLSPPQNSSFFRFEPGYVYNIKVAVFGTEEIKVFADIEGWKKGDDVPEEPVYDF